MCVSEGNPLPNLLSRALRAHLTRNIITIITIFTRV